MPVFDPVTLTRFAPVLFIFIWSSGYVVAKYAAPHAQPLTFLLLLLRCGGVDDGVGSGRARPVAQLA
jgi:hypothetical protein